MKIKLNHGPFHHNLLNKVKFLLYKLHLCMCSYSQRRHITQFFLSLMCLTWTGTHYGKDRGSGSVNGRANECPHLYVLACVQTGHEDTASRGRKCPYGRSKSFFGLTVRCWKSHALMMLVATLGKMPLFLLRFFSLSGSSSSPVLGEATLLSRPSPVT